MPTSLDLLLTEWKNLRAWLRYEIQVRCETFVAHYKVRAWRVYPKSTKRTNRGWDVEPVFPVPGAPYGTTDDPSLVWRWTVPYVVRKDAAFLPRSSTSTKPFLLANEWWTCGEPPPVSQLTSTDHKDFPFSAARAKGYRDDFRSIQDLLDCYAEQFNLYQGILQAYGNVARSLDLVRENFDQRLAAAQLDRQRGEDRARARNLYSVQLRELGILTRLQATPPTCVPSPQPYLPTGAGAAQPSTTKTREQLEHEEFFGPSSP